MDYFLDAFAENRELFDQLVSSLKKYGYATDVDLKISRVAVDHSKQSKFNSLFKEYYPREGHEFKVATVAFKDQEEGFLYLIYDVGQFDNFADLKMQLREDGHNVQ
ncbi:hypothetical protein [Undibacterium terreum]|uniref:Uncharacterized protein n=1 Tax=Undibacterium terreum TaxID=1224302 RepID=A0A916URN7_9BURK|nr:hypothetical protein [Undibacterium terreum]GGC83568.1 hypothetical protein GCM10011396_33710 [Undibacterium terreum]